MKRQRISEAEQKLIVLELLSGKKTVGQISKERGISDSAIYKWRDKALKAIDTAFKAKNNQINGNSEVERERLLKIIGEQACVIDTLKKTSELFLR